MFGEGPVTHDFQLSWTKCSYFVRFGLLPYFRDVLACELKSSSFFSISFDESLNKSLQKNQMDVQIDIGVLRVIWLRYGTGVLLSSMRQVLKFWFLHYWRF